MQARFICAAAAELFASGAHAARLQVTGGAIQGKTLGDRHEIYLRIPYAAPPVGALRWMPPQQIVPWRCKAAAAASPSSARLEAP